MGHVFWLTGLSGAGKTSLAEGAAEILQAAGYTTIVLDGDVMRKGLCQDLGFSDQDRAENNRRCAEVAKLISLKSNVLCLCAFISPLTAMRTKVKQIIQNNFKLVYVKCALETCMARDPKGNYKRVQSGMITGYTGVGAPYEEPTDYDLCIDTNTDTLDISVQHLVKYILEHV